MIRVLITIVFNNISGMFFFSCIWSIGAVCDSETKVKFNLIFTELLKGDLSDDLIKTLQLGSCEIPPLETPYVFPPPKDSDVFGYKVLLHLFESIFQQRLPKFLLLLNIN